MSVAVRRKISIIGLGYVGLPVAVAFSCSGFEVIGFDIDERRIGELREGYDRTHEIDERDLAASAMHLTTETKDLVAADFHIITVPTPIDESNRPDLTPLIRATETISAVLKRGDVVVYESTVYPGATEDVCVPLLEQGSGLKLVSDFSVGYSPERINPGDREHRFDSIVKVVSASDASTLAIVRETYGAVVHAGIHVAPNIRTAEAAKIIENTQRDLNIALMNELAIICEKLCIDTRDVLSAAGTKWNFLPFTPGLVGGHCIGVDPYYLMYRAEKAGYLPQVIHAGRRINDGMAAFVVQELVKRLLTSGRATGELIVTVLGVTFKEDVPDVRNSKSVDVVLELQKYGITVQVVDPEADPAEVLREYGIDLVQVSQVKPADAVVLSVGHKIFAENGWDVVSKLLKDGQGIVSDIKGVLDRKTTPEGVMLWRL